MAGRPPVAGRSSAGGSRLRRSSAWHAVLLTGACASFAAIGARWLHAYRSPPLLDIDEAGYLAYALQDLRAWEAAGVGGWWDAVMSPSIQAPLLTATSTPFFVVLGAGALVGLLVPLSYVCLTLFGTWWLAREVGSAGVAWLAWALCASAPALIVYSRHYSFGSAAAATTTLALAALARSRGLSSTRWTLVTGLLIGLIALSRTVMLALIPGMVLAMLAVALVGPQVVRRLLNLALAGLVAVAVAAPWYVVNGQAVLDYLTSFGYGSRSSEYGSSESVLSAGSWLRMTQYSVKELGVVLAGLLLIGSILLLTSSARTREGASATTRPHVVVRLVRWPFFPMAFFLAWSLLLLTSTGNKGTGFIVPLIPPACVLAAAGMWRSGTVVRRSLAVAVACTLAVTTVAHADARGFLADRHTVDLPVLGESVVLDGAGRTDSIVRRARPGVAGETPAMSQAERRRWVRATAHLARQIDQLRGPEGLTVFGFRHLFVNANGVQFAQLDADRPQLPMDQISPPVATDVATTQQWLTSIDTCLLVTAPGSTMEIEPTIDQRTVIDAAKALGFARAAPAWRLPNGRPVQVWRSPTCQPQESG